MRTPLAPPQQDAVARMQEILQDDFVSLQVKSYEVREDFERGTCHIRATVLEAPSLSISDVDADGVGMIDAFFTALNTRYAAEHPSLQSLRFTRVTVTGLLNESTNGRGTDARAQAEIGVTNSYGTEFSFGAVTPSVSRSSLEAVAAAVEFFVNSERAYVTAWRALEHAKSGGRHDLVSRYTDWLSHIVRNTSYSAVIERLRGG
jgi:hypothetical protein